MIRNMTYLRQLKNLNNIKNYLICSRNLIESKLLGTPKRSECHGVLLYLYEKS